MLRASLSLLCLLAAAAGTARAETLYVTDILRLGLYSEPTTSEEPLRYLTSGTALEVLDRDGSAALVRGPDGTEGWVRATYLVSEPPARFRLAGLETDNAELTGQLTAARRELTEAAGKLSELEARMASASTAGRTVESLRRQNRELDSRIDALGLMVPYSWVLAGFAVSLLLGFISGLAFLDYLIRRRFGGVRIY
ncbi:MAG TPA: TIGR04211 family SH3 domain-containing protein [Gammaproteobacteria bacterium]|nr:TIGR04211 family SH3 domain-containing protein [Gammaproteobacteria bacterium]